MPRPSRSRWPALSPSPAKTSRSPAPRSSRPGIRPPPTARFKNDYDYDTNDFKAPSSRSRAEVIAELKVPRDPALIGPLRSRNYNPGGMETLRVSTLPRAQVKAEVVAAVRDGTLRRTDYDDEGVRVARRAPARTPAPVLAGTARNASGS